MKKKTLISLVGSNPLPVAVVATYLKSTEEVDKIVLVHSNENKDIRQMGTRDFAENIKKYLLSKNWDSNAIVYWDLNDVGVSYEIEKDMERNMKKISGPIILDYTGGTKAMAVHTYQFLKEKFKTKIDAVYLDARTFQLVYNGMRKLEDLREKVEIDLKDIALLYGYEEPQGDFKKPLRAEFNNIYTYLKKDIIAKGKISDLLLFKEKNEFHKLKSAYCKKPNSDNEQDIRNFLKNEMPDEFATLSREILTQFDRSNISGKELKSFRKELLGFLDGKWLEEYVYENLSKKLDKEKCSKVNIFHSVEFKKKDARTGNEKCEIDVLIVRGYQLYGISCTTSSYRGVCKGKGFEIFYRIKQIGGDEAYPILITGMNSDKAEGIERDLSVFTGGKESILVLGTDDFSEEKMSDKIYNFIFQI